PPARSLYWPDPIPLPGTAAESRALPCDAVRTQNPLAAVDRVAQRVTARDDHLARRPFESQCPPRRRALPDLADADLVEPCNLATLRVEQPTARKDQRRTRLFEVTPRGGSAHRDQTPHGGRAGGERDAGPCPAGPRGTDD